MWLTNFYEQLTDFEDVQISQQQFISVFPYRYMVLPNKSGVWFQNASKLTNKYNAVPWFITTNN